MNRHTKMINLVSTGLISLMMLGSAGMYFFTPEGAESFKALGFPDYFRIQLGVAKITGVAVLLIPLFSHNIKEWAYAGFGITFISATYSHAMMGDSISKILMPLFALGILVVSYISLKKLERSNKTQITS